MFIAGFERIERLHSAGAARGVYGEWYRKVMKLVAFIKDGVERIGLFSDDETSILVLDFGASGRYLSMVELLSKGPELLDLIKSKRSELTSLPLSEVMLLPPIRDPAGIFCIGLNYSEHEREAPVAGSDYPTVFLRLARNQIAQGEAMITPNVSDSLDWEGELVAVIGKGGRHIKPKNAFDHIFGYSIYNEASVREFQHHSSQFGMGKNFEGTGAFGPCIITADAFGDPYEQSIVTRLGDEVVQSAKIGTMMHRIEDVISYISSATKLMPGDIICTGTPSGVGAARKPQRFMKDGETVSVEISGIGTLENPVRAEIGSEAQ